MSFELESYSTAVDISGSHKHEKCLVRTSIQLTAENEYIHHDARNKEGVGGRKLREGEIHPSVKKIVVETRSMMEWGTAFSHIFSVILQSF